ncbi:hypothetical protein B0T18DRAFT_472802 [Schizothecium vesticola]|uniref:Enoyl reductase (ER) domain-containing protein n=1 Tax=Schizothecium vesticola TaxID=314040 RepID=A0AA40K0F0_9PEZI|nr:hypothetical protein B0T18DRAFT_472802 [Schizothecium vesticola]
MATPDQKFMTAVDIHNKTGPATSLYLNSSTPVPVPGPGEALIKIHAFGLNRMDLLQREGHYPLPPSAPSTLGVEFSGTVVSTNPPNHSSFPAGLPVFGLAPGGAYAQYLAVSTQLLMPKPAHLSFEQAAAVPETWMTATQALHFLLELQPGQTVLWHAGASGVSIAGIQLSVAAGAGAVFATVGSDDKVAFVEGELGATKGVNYKTGDWVKEVLEATGGRGVDCVVDLVGGGDYFNKNLDVLAKDGRVAVLGLLGGRVAERVDVGKLLFKRARVQGSSLRSRSVEYQGKLRERLEEEALPRFETGEFRVFVERVMPWGEIVEAHQLMEGNQTKGKIVCTVE